MKYKVIINLWNKDKVALDINIFRATPLSSRINKVCEKIKLKVKKEYGDVEYSIDKIELVDYVEA